MGDTKAPVNEEKGSGDSSGTQVMVLMGLTTSVPLLRSNLFCKSGWRTFGSVPVVTGILNWYSV